MPHLEPERLAALDHDAPTPDELAHLAGCAECRAERDAFVALTTLARESASESARDSTCDEGPRLTSWDSLSTALRKEGLLTSTVDITPLSTPLVVRALDGSAARLDPSRAARADDERATLTSTTPTATATASRSGGARRGGPAWRLPSRSWPAVWPPAEYRRAPTRSRRAARSRVRSRAPAIPRWPS